MPRTWEWRDPEPDDRPHLMDDLGHIWIYDAEGDDETGLWPGWFNPLADAPPCGWRDLWQTHGVEHLYEIDEEELERREHELFGWYDAYPDGKTKATDPYPDYVMRRDDGL